MKSSIFFICLIFAASSAQAQETVAAFVGAYTWHPQKPRNRYKLNDHNRLLAYEYSGWIGGYFENSYYHDTIFVGRIYHHRWSRDVLLSFVVGIDRGYKSCWPVNGGFNAPTRTCPLATAAISYIGWPVQPTLILLPEAVSVSARIPLN